MSGSVKGSEMGQQPEWTKRTHRAVVFDMDGVLVHSEHLWERMWSRFADAHGVTWTDAQTKQVQGMSAPEWAAFLAEFSRTTESVSHTEQRVVDDMIAALDAGEIHLLDGAERMVTEVARQAPIALASSAPRRLIDAVLDRHGLAHLFAATVSSAEVDHGKPSPDVYLAAVDKLGEQAEHCLAVEDSSNGLRAAGTAGMTVIALPNTDYSPAPDALALAHRVAADLDEVRQHLMEALAEPVGS